MLTGVNEVYVRFARWKWPGAVEQIKPLQAIKRDQPAAQQSTEEH